MAGGLSVRAIPRVKHNVIGLGEVLWDLLPGGRQLGGAPANFAYHAGALGAAATVISRVGNDPLGREVRQRLADLGVSTECLEVDDVAPTGTVGVDLSPEGQPRYTIHEGVAWDGIRGEAAGRRAAAAADAVCFGTLAQRREPARSAVRSLVAAMRPDAWRVLDVNLRQHFHSHDVLEGSLALANGVKLNESELPVLAGNMGLRGSEREQLVQLAGRFQLRVVAYTRGERGSLLLHDGRWSERGPAAVRVADTVGAGDSFTAAMVLGLLAGWDLEVVHDRAAGVAAYVCTQRGATPALPDSLKAPFLAAAGEARTEGGSAAGALGRAGSS